MHFAVRVGEFPVPSIIRVSIELFPTILCRSNVLQFRFNERCYPTTSVVFGHLMIHLYPRAYDLSLIWSDPHLILLFCGYSELDDMPAAPRKFDVIVLGAGAAGLMCAAVAGQRGRRVALLEHNCQPGRKILISGGGRCNFTNLHCGPANFLSTNPHFAKSALALYQPRHFIELVERYGIAWHEKTLGQLFCDGSARAILDMLLAECERGGVEIALNAHEIQVERGSSGG